MQVCVFSEGKVVQSTSWKHMFPLIVVEKMITGSLKKDQWFLYK